MKRFLEKGVARAAWLVGMTAGASACAAAAPYSESAHFDGERFHNPDRTEPPGFMRVARHILFGRSGDWPSERLPVRRALRVQQDPPPSQVFVTFVNHATVLIQLPGLNVLTDPVWSERVGPFSWAGPLRARDPGIPFERLPAIDVVLISHNHYDHLDLPTLKRLSARDRPRVFVPLGDRAWLMDEGIARVTELDWWDSVALDDGTEIVFTPAQHNSGRLPWTNNRSLWGSFVVRQGPRGLYFAGDTAYGTHFMAVRERFGPVDLAFLPIGAYAPRDMMKRSHMNPAEAVRAQRDLEAKNAVAIHFGAFQLTAEDFDQPVAELRQALSTSPGQPGPFVALAEGRTRAFTWGSQGPLRTEGPSTALRSDEPGRALTPR